MASDRQHRVRRAVRWTVRRSQHDGRALWRFFRRGETKRARLARARGIVFVARALQNRAAKRANLANYRLTHADDLTAEQKDRLRRRRRLAWEAHAKWGKFRPVYRRQAKRLAEKIRTAAVISERDFEPWMVNGHSTGISPGTKRLAVWIVAHGGIVTDTYDFGGHAPSSFHYPRNNPDGLGHALDWIPASCTEETNAKDHFGPGFFKELFGPCSWYVKYGQIVQMSSGPFPGHGDHEHGAPYT